MIPTESIETIKALAKKLGRARRIKHISALDLTAQQLGYSHWNDLTVDYKKGWRPSSTQVESLREFIDTINPLRARESDIAGWGAFSCIPGLTLKTSNSHPSDTGDPFSEEEILGELDGHQFHLMVSMDDVIMEGRGWRILVPEAPSAKPIAGVTDRRLKSNPIVDSDFFEKALKVALIRAEQVRARIASDWPRRSTVPDADGKVEHPLFEGTASRWSCLHCDQIFSGKQMADNLWHCPDPNCDGSPIDMHIAESGHSADS